MLLEQLIIRLRELFINVVMCVCEYAIASSCVLSAFNTECIDLRLYVIVFK